MAATGHGTHLPSQALRRQRRQIGNIPQPALAVVPVEPTTGAAAELCPHAACTPMESMPSWATAPSASWPTTLICSFGSSPAAGTTARRSTNKKFGRISVMHRFSAPAIFCWCCLLLAGCWSSGTPKVETVQAPAPDPLARAKTLLTNYVNGMPVTSEADSFADLAA